MDIFSGSSPRKFIPLRLGIPNEREQTPTSLPDQPAGINQNVNVQSAQSLPGIATVLPPLPIQGPLSGSSNSSGEDVNAFATKKVAEMESDNANSSNQDNSCQVSSDVNVKDTLVHHDLAPNKQPSEIVTETHMSGSECTESEPSKFPDLNKYAHNSVVTTDISGGESGEEDHLYGVGKSTGQTPNLPSSSFPRFSSTLHVDPGHSDEEAEEYRRTVLTEDRELTASARLAVRHYFANNDRFNLPTGHPAVVFSEPQVYHVLRAISDDSVMSNFKLTKNLVLEATGLRAETPSRHNQRTASFRKRQICRDSSNSSDESDGRGELPGSESELNSPGPGCQDSGGYTSAAMHTGDEVGSVKFYREQIPTNDAGFLEQPVTPRASTSSLPQHPSPGESSQSSEYTLATILERCLVAAREKQTLPVVTEVAEPAQSPEKPPKSSPQRAVPKPQILTKEYSKGMTWTRTFVCGPKDPLKNKYMFYCQLCKRNLSCKSKGAAEILRHHKSEKHLRLDQRWRYEHLKTYDPVRGKTRYEVRDKYGRVLEPYELERERPFFIDAPLVDLGPKFPFYHDVVDGTVGEPSSDDRHLKVHLSLVANLLPNSGNFAFLQTLWTNVGLIANYRESFMDFDWSKDFLLVSTPSFACLNPLPSLLFFQQGIEFRFEDHRYFHSGYWV